MPPLLDFSRYPLGINLAVAAAAAVGVWVAGTRLTREANVIAERTGAGQAFIGLLLLGTIVSLPELSTSVTASLLGNGTFAVNTLVGGISATMVALAVVDALVPDQPVSSDITHPVVLLQGALTVLFLVVAAAGMMVGDVPLLGAGAWSIALLVLYVLVVRLVEVYERHEPWVPTGETDSTGKADEAKRGEVGGGAPGQDRRPMSRIIMATAAWAVATLVAGMLLATAGTVVADQSGLGSGIVGMLLGGVATSLPEATTFYAAVRIRKFELAFGDAFGTNLFSTMAIAVADFAYPGGPVLPEAGRFGTFGILLGMALTAIYLAGCIERRNRSVLGMGVDSLLVLFTYVGGMVLLFRIR
jgi:cation:H+ antiporter